MKDCSLRRASGIFFGSTGTGGAEGEGGVSAWGPAGEESSCGVVSGDRGPGAGGGGVVLVVVGMFFRWISVDVLGCASRGVPRCLRSSTIDRG